MKDCVYLSTCPIFARFQLESMKNMWIRLYCKGSKQDECARLVLRRKGEKPLVTMLPSGEHILD